MLAVLGVQLTVLLEMPVGLETELTVVYASMA
jgi:hypothetical protein